MDGKFSMWEPWYLDMMMTTTRPSKVQCKFCGLKLIYCKYKMFSHLGYHLQRGGKRGVGLCAKVRPQVKFLFTRCGGNFLAALNDAQVSSSFPNLDNEKSSGSFNDSFVADL